MMNQLNKEHEVKLPWLVKLACVSMSKAVDGVIFGQTCFGSNSFEGLFYGS